MYHVVKRDGKVAEFNVRKISDAITKAFEAQNKQYHPSTIDMLALRVTSEFEPLINAERGDNVFGNLSPAKVEEIIEKCKANGHDIIIDSPIDQSATICDINGHARSVSLKAGRNVIPTRATGVHIVRVGNATAKLFIK